MIPDCVNPESAIEGDIWDFEGSEYEILSKRVRGNGSIVIEFGQVGEIPSDEDLVANTISTLPEGFEFKESDGLLGNPNLKTSVPEEF